MNDRQLIDALRAIGSRPVEVDPTFADRLWRELPHQRRPVPAPIRRELLLVALLVLAGLAVALAVGARLIQDQLLLADASATPALHSAPASDPTPSTAQHPVHFPSGVQPTSDVDAVAAVALSVLDGQSNRVTAMAVIPPGVAFPSDGGSWTSRTDPVWGVQVRQGLEALVVFVVDGSLEVAGTMPIQSTIDPNATPVPLPTEEPVTQIELVSDQGRTVPASIVPIGPAGMPPANWPPAVLDGNLWWLLGSADTPGPAHLVRIDATGSAAVFDLPEGVYTSVVGGRDRLWLQGSGGVHEVDPGSGAIRRTLASPPFGGSLLAEDDDGLWFRISVSEPTVGGGAQFSGGALLVDPEIGFAVRRIMFRETGGQAYTGIWQPPAFGSLWDVDRGTGRLHRIDRVTGADLASVHLPTTEPYVCNDPRPATGIEGLPPLMVVDCSDATVLIDPATNTVLRALPLAARPPFGSSFAGLNDPIVAAGSLWATLVSNSEGIDQVGRWYPGGLLRLDPVTGGPLETLTLSRTGRTAILPVVAGDSMWLMFGAHTLLRITLADLAG